MRDLATFLLLAAAVVAALGALCFLLGRAADLPWRGPDDRGGDEPNHCGEPPAAVVVYSAAALRRSAEAGDRLRRLLRDRAVGAAKRDGRSRVDEADVQAALAALTPSDWRLSDE